MFNRRVRFKMPLALLCLLFVCLLFAPLANASSLGDVNGDGNIDVQDVVHVMRHVLELDTLAPNQKTFADVNHDGEVDVNDVVLIMRYVLGIITAFPVPIEEVFINSVTDSLGNVNTNSFAKESGGDWSGGLEESPIINVGDTITFTINASDAPHRLYKFLYQPPGMSFIVLRDWDSSNEYTWTVPAEALGRYTIVKLQVKNNDGYNALGFCDDYTYLTYIVGPQ